MKQKEQLIEKPKKEELRNKWEQVNLLIGNNIDAKPGCNACDGKGRLRVAKEGYGWDTKYCKCYNQANSLNKIKKLLLQSNIPDAQLRLLSFDTYREDVLRLQMMVSFVLDDTDKPWLYLYGNP